MKGLDYYRMTPTVFSEINCSGVETKDGYGFGSGIPVFHVSSTVLYYLKWRDLKTLLFDYVSFYIIH
jgi:hypothetical protein